MSRRRHHRKAGIKVALILTDFVNTRLIQTYYWVHKTAYKYFIGYRITPTDGCA